MKIDKDGKIILSKHEKRVGNFVISNDGMYVSIRDINGIMAHKISKNCACGQYLLACWRRAGEKDIQLTLGNYITVMWNVACVVPDIDFLSEVNRSAIACMERHPQIYGFNVKEQTPEQEAETLEGLREDAEIQAKAKEAEKEADKDA